MSWMVIYLGLLSPAASSNLPGSRRAALCFLFGLASDGVYICPACCQTGGSLLHCLSTLTALSVSGKTAVYFCCTVLGVASTRRYLASCPVKPGLSSPAPWKTDYSACPYRSSDHLPYSDRNYIITVLFFCPAYWRLGITSINLLWTEPPICTMYASTTADPTSSATPYFPVIFKKMRKLWLKATPCWILPSLQRLPPPWELLSRLVPQTTLDFFQSREGEPIIEKIRGEENVIHY